MPILQGLLLSEVPERFFDPCAWAEIQSYAGQRYNALAMLSAPVPEQNGDSWWGPIESSEQFRIRSRIAQKARELAYQFRSRLCEGAYIAAGFFQGSASRVVVDPDLCRELWPWFATDRLCGLNLEFTHVRVMEAAERPGASELLLKSVIDWLRARMVEGECHRKILEHEAKMHFGDILTNRIFDAAYKAVFNRSRGRPRAR
jgi:hypothetical protein